MIHAVDCARGILAPPTNRKREEMREICIWLPSDLKIQTKSIVQEAFPSLQHLLLTATGPHTPPNTSTYNKKQTQTRSGC